MRPRWLLVAAVALAAGGCGQKGPLYLPDKNAKVVTTPAAPAPAPAAAAPGTTQPAASPKPKSNDPDQDSQPQPPK